MRLEVPQLLAWVPSEWWQPTLSESDLAREVYLHGGDVNGAFRKKISYAWGRIAVGEKERKKEAQSANASPATASDGPTGTVNAAVRGGPERRLPARRFGIERSALE